MSIKYICNICKEEIKLYSGSTSNMMTIVITGGKWMRIGSENQFRNTKSVLHIHSDNCYEKFLSIFRRKNNESQNTPN